MKTVHQYFMTGLGILFPVMVSAEVPVWWVEHGVIDTNMAENDYAPVNQGQAKHVAYRAYLTFEQVFGSAGSGVTDLISGFSDDDNLLLMNLGQLKYMAAPFYQHLNTMGLTNLWPAGMTTGPYPWSGSTHASQDYAIASIGQLKYLFSFRLDAMIDTDGDGLNDQAELDIGTNPFSADSDGDGIADGWEALYGLDPLAGSDALADTDSDGLTNAEEFERRTDPSAATPGGLLVVLPDTGTRRVNEPYLELGNP